MTTAQETLQPGRELDAKVAEALGKVIHWADELTGSTEYAPLIEDEGSWYRGKATTTECPHYSTSIEAAWQLVELAHEKYSAAFELTNGITRKRRASFHGCLNSYRGESDTAPHAICLAYLALVENERE